MRYAIAGILLLGAFAVATAAAQTGPVDSEPDIVTDARSAASDGDIRDARRAYRTACNRHHQNADYCDCTTAGVAQALAPQDVRLAARTLGERINAASGAPDTDTPPEGASASARIAHVESFYANACAQYRN